MDVAAIADAARASNTVLTVMAVVSLRRASAAVELSEGR